MATFGDIIKASQKTSLPTSSIPEVKPFQPKKELSTLDKISGLWKDKKLNTFTKVGGTILAPFISSESLKPTSILSKGSKLAEEQILKPIAEYGQEGAKKSVAGQIIGPSYQAFQTVIKAPKEISEAKTWQDKFSKATNAGLSSLQVLVPAVQFYGTISQNVIDAADAGDLGATKLLRKGEDKIIEGISKVIPDIVADTEEKKKSLASGLFNTAQILVQTKGASAVEKSVINKVNKLGKIPEGITSNKALYAGVLANGLVQSSPDLLKIAVAQSEGKESKGITASLMAGLGFLGTPISKELKGKKSAIPEIKPEAPVKELPKIALDKIIPENEVIAKDIIKQETLAAEKKSPTKSLGKIAPEDIKLYSEYNKLPLSEQKGFEQFKTDKQVIAITPKETTKQPTVLDKILPTVKETKPVIETVKPVVETVKPVVETVKPIVETVKPIVKEKYTVEKMKEGIAKLDKQNEDMSKRVKNQPFLKRIISENIRKIDFINKEIDKKIKAQELNKPVKVSIESILEQPTTEKPELKPDIKKVEQLTDIFKQNKLIGLEENKRIKAEIDKQVLENNLKEGNEIKKIYDDFIKNNLSQDEIINKIIDNKILSDTTKDNLLNSFQEILTPVKEGKISKIQKDNRFTELMDEVTSPDRLPNEDLITKINSDTIINEKQKIELIKGLGISNKEAIKYVKQSAVPEIKSIKKEAILEEPPFDLTEEQVQKQELEKVVNEEISSIKKEAKDELVDAVGKKGNVRLTPLAKVGKKVWGGITSIYGLNSHLNDIKVKIGDKAEASVIELVRSFQVGKKKVATNIFNRLLKNTVDTLDNKMIDDSFNKILQDADNIIDTSKVINNRIEGGDKSKVKEKVKDVFDAVVGGKNFIRNIPSLGLNKKYKSIEKLAAIQHLYSYNPEYFKSNYPELATYLDGIQTNLDKISKVVYGAAGKDLQDRGLLKFIGEDYKHDIVLKSVFEKWFKEVEFEMDKINYKFNSFQQFKSFVEANRDNSKFKNSSIASILKEKGNAEDYHIKSDLYRLIDYMSEYGETVGNDNIYKTIKSLTKSADEGVRKYSEGLRGAGMFGDAVMQLSGINPVRAGFIGKGARALGRVALAKVIIGNARVFGQAITSGLAKTGVNAIIENIKGLTPLAKGEKPKLYNPINYKNLREATPTLEKYGFLEVSDFGPDLDNKTLLDKSINVFAGAPIDKAFKYSNSMLLMQKFLKDNNISFKGGDALDITNKFDEMMQNKSIAEQVKIENEIHDMNDTISNFNPDGRSRLKLISNIPTMGALKTFGLSTTGTNLKQFSNLIDGVYQLNKEGLKQAGKAGQILATNFGSYYAAYAIGTTLFNKIFGEPEDEDEKQMQVDFSKKYANQSVGNPVDIAVNATLGLANSIAFIPFKDVKAGVSAIIEFVRTNNPEAIEVGLDKILQGFAAYQTVSNISGGALDSLIKSSLGQGEETTPTTAGGSIKGTGAGDIMSPYGKKLFKTLLFDLDSTVTNSVISKINDIQRKSKEAEQKGEVFVPTKEDNWFVDALNILVPSMEDIDAKIGFVIKDYKDFLGANQSDESFERQGLNPLLKFASYSKDMDIARNRNYTYSVLKMLEDYKKKSNGEPLFYKDLADLIGLKEESVLSEAQDKNLTNVKNVNKQIEKILNESYPKLYAMYGGDVIAMTDDLKENNPVAYNNFVGGLVRVKRILDEGGFDSTTERGQEKVAQEFSSGRGKNVIDGAISTYNKTKPLSTSFAEQVKQTISGLKSNDTNQIKNKLATLEAISKLIVKDAAYTKNASDSIAEMVNSLSKKDLETLYDLPGDRDLILEQYPTIKELLQYSLTLRGVDVPKEQFKTTGELIGKGLPIPEIKEEIISEPTTNITKEITPITGQTGEDKYTSAIDKLQFFPQEKKKKETKSKSLTELLGYDKQPKKSGQTIQTSSYLDKSNSAMTALDKILNFKR